MEILLNGSPVAVRPGQTIMDAADAAGQHIPRLCHDPKLKPSGSCRLCVVQVKGARGLVAACSTPVAPGMEIQTESEMVREARREVLDLLVSNHPLDCFHCEAAGDCRLQDYAYQYGIKEGSYVGARRKVEVDDRNPFFRLDYEKCILCGICVRTCDEVMGYGAIDFTARGFETLVGTPYGVALQDSSCVFCGNCVQGCPVGALVPKSQVGQARSWELKKVRSICPYCGVGCALDIHIKGNRVIKVEGAESPANHTLTCVKGRFGWEFIHHEDRLLKPLRRRSDAPRGPVGREWFEEVSWDEALAAAAGGIARVREGVGPDAVAGLSSAKASNEENYLFQKFMRCAVGTNNVDYCARL
ncbi:MAG TPA: 2Fe-2S iron-sulfur cluster-binding protein [Symbiobacteriaceae bacterium]|nr:2Fe-2S iron-sulfur cluster-binding protein [Symbiobacteriaceae bacterium]